ncbi:MAG: hypothetical protein R3B09_06340 [Nannocystaceae bacterium]
MRSASRRLRIVAALGIAACRASSPTSSPEAAAEVSPGEARRIAEATLPRSAGEGAVAYHYAGIHDNGPAFLVHYTIERPCPAREPVAEAKPELEPVADAQPEPESRDFTAVVDLCPTGSPGGVTVEVQKADGGARVLAGE